MENYRKSFHCTYNIKYRLSMDNKIPKVSDYRAGSYPDKRTWQDDLPK